MLGHRKKEKKALCMQTYSCFLGFKGVGGMKDGDFLYAVRQAGTTEIIFAFRKQQKILLLFFGKYYLIYSYFCDILNL